MGNDCWNNITLVSHDNSDELKQLDNEFQCESKEYKFKGDRGIKFSIITRNEPDFELLEHLYSKYSNCWIKNEWSEEGGLAGVWAGGCKGGKKEEIRQLVWEDLCMEAKYEYFNFNDGKEFIFDVQHAPVTDYGMDRDYTQAEEDFARLQSQSYGCRSPVL